MQLNTAKQDEYNMTDEYEDSYAGFSEENKGKQKREFDRDKKNRQQQRGKARDLKRNGWD